MKNTIFLLLTILLFSCNKEESNMEQKEIYLIVKNKYTLSSELFTRNNDLSDIRLRLSSKDVRGREVFFCNFISKDGIRYELENRNDDYFFENFNYDKLGDYRLSFEVIGRSESIILNQNLDSDFKRADYIYSSSCSYLYDKTIEVLLYHKHIWVDVTIKDENFESKEQFQNYLNHLTLKFHTEIRNNVKLGDINSNKVKDENGDVIKFRAIIPTYYISKKLFSISNIDNTKNYDCVLGNEVIFEDGNKLDVKVTFINDKIKYDVKNTSIVDSSIKCNFII
jgi:hypothetical protein